MIHTVLTIKMYTGDLSAFIESATLVTKVSLDHIVLVSEEKRVTFSLLYSLKSRAGAVTISASLVWCVPGCTATEGNQHFSTITHTHVPPSPVT